MQARFYFFMVTTLVALIAGTGSDIQELKPPPKVGTILEDSECPTSPDVYPVIGTSIEENPDQSLEPVQFDDPPVTERVLPTGATTAGLPYNHPGWVPLGPPNVGGRTTAILPIILDDKVVIFAGGHSGGVWRSDDDGKSWMPPHNLMPNYNIASLAADPNGSAIYAGTGPIRGMAGVGILKSTDGWTWTVIEHTRASLENADFSEQFKYTNTLAFSKDGTTLVAGTDKGIYYSEDAAHEEWKKAEFLEGNGTVIAENQWERISNIAVHPDNDEILVASGKTSKLFLSIDGGRKWYLIGNPPQEFTNAAGQSLYSNPKGRISVCFAKAKKPGESQPRVYALVESNKLADPENEGQWLLHGGSAELWEWEYDDQKLPNEQASFKVVNNILLLFRFYSDFFNCIWAGDPEDPDLIVVGGIVLMRSTDGGATFEEIITRKARAWVDQNFLAAHPNYGNEEEITIEVNGPEGQVVRQSEKIKTRKFFVCNDGGIFKTLDIKNVGLNVAPPSTEVNWDDLLSVIDGKKEFRSNKSWFENMNNGYNITQFYFGRGNPNSRVVLGGAQDRSVKAHIPGEYNWESVQREGDGADIAYDPEDESRFYISTQNLNIKAFKRNVDASNITTEWSLISNVTQNLHDNHNAVVDRVAFAAQFKLDPLDRKVLYAGGVSLARTVDARGGTSSVEWKPLKPILTANDSYRKITTFAVARTADALQTAKHSDNLSNLIVVGYTYSKIFMTKNANLKDEYILDEVVWEEISIPNKDCRKLIIDPHLPSRFYGCFAKYGEATGNLWRWENGEWEDISKGKLPDIPVYTMTVHPERPDWLYAGTEKGLYTSADGGESWSVSFKGPVAARVSDLFWMDNTLCVVTYGRGIFQVDIPAQDPTSRIVGSPDGKVGYFTRDYEGTGRLAHSKDQDLSLTNTIGQTLELNDATSFDDLYGKDLGGELKNSAFMGDAIGKIHWVDNANLSEKSGWPISTSGNKSIFAKPALWKNPGNKQAMNLLVSNSDGLFSIPLKDSPNESITPAYAFPSNLNIQESYSNEVMDNWAYLATDKAMLAYRLIGDETGAMKKFEVDGNAIKCTAAPLLAAQTLYVVGQVGTEYKIVAFHPRTGEVIWQEDGNLDSKPLQPVWSQGMIVVACENGTIVTYEFDKGNKRTQKDSAMKGHYSLSSSAIIKGIRAEDNTLNVLVEDGTQYHVHQLNVQQVSGETDKVHLYQISREEYPSTAPKNYLPLLPAAPENEMPNVLVDERDGQIYGTVNLNNRLWMAENLNYDIGEGCSFYDNDPSYSEKYGRLYTQDAAKNACPIGWRLPTIEEYCDLALTHGGYYYTYGGGSRKDQYGNNPEAAYSALIDGGSSGFNALLGGSSLSGLEGVTGSYWSSKKYHHLTFNEGEIKSSGSSPSVGHYVRCTKE